jgi:hypothetical protein
VHHRPNRSASRAAVAASAIALLMALPTAALAQSANTLQGSLEELNDSGGSGSASVTFDGDQATVEITSSGLLDGSPHAMHIHNLETGTPECPTLDADEDGDGLVNTVEGQPSYGPINVSLTTEGDVSADSGLAVERFPATGDIDYSRTFSLPDGVSADGLGDQFVIVQHGVDVNGSGQYDGDQMSELNPELPLEATLPATCGVLTVSQMGATPQGGVATGGGGTADRGPDAGLVALGLAAVALAGLVVRSRRASAQL